MFCSMVRVWRYGLATGWLGFAMGCDTPIAEEASGQRAAAGATAGAASVAGSGSVAGRASMDVANPARSETIPGGRGGSGGSGGSGAGVKASGSSPAGSRGASAAAGGGSGSGGGGTPAAAAEATPKGKLYSDDFEDGNLTMPSWIDADPELGGMWQVVAADGGKVLTQSASVSDWVIAAGGDYRWTDQVVEARVKITAEPGKAGIFARLRDTRNYYFLYLDGGSNLVLRKRIDNSSGDIQKVKIETQADTWYTLKLSVIGDALTGYLDGEMLVSGLDSGVSSGGIAVGTSDCTAQFDDITVHGSE